MEVKSHAKFLRLSPRKARLVVDAVRGKKAVQALAILKLMPKKAAHEIYKVLNSAIANAEHNFGLKKDDLVMKEIVADQGPTFKRYKPRARGSADVMRRKMTHISITLISETGAKPQLPPKVKPEVIKEDKPKAIKEKSVKEESAKLSAEEAKVADKKVEEKEVKETVKSKTTVKKTISKPKAKPSVKDDQPKKQDHSLLGGFKSFFRRKGK